MELSQVGARVALQFLERTTLSAKEIPSFLSLRAELQAIAKGPDPAPPHPAIEALKRKGKAGTGAKPQAKPRRQTPAKQ